MKYNNSQIERFTPATLTPVSRSADFSVCSAPCDLATPPPSELIFDSASILTPDDELKIAHLQSRWETSEKRRVLRRIAVSCLMLVLPTANLISIIFLAARSRVRGQLARFINWLIPWTPGAIDARKQGYINKLNRWRDKL